MKVGILTYHWVSNFGANLQALSTYCYLKNTGHEPIIINWVPADLEEIYREKVLPCQIISHQQFVKENFPCITRVCRTDEDIAREIERNCITRVLIGSDAVFTNLPKLSRYRLSRKGIVHLKPKSDSDFPNPFWGSFVHYLSKPIDIVAISASAQNMPYKTILFSKEKNSYKNALLRFRRISVRDVWTKNMIEYVTSGKLVPEITPDPVFAFEQNVHPHKIGFVRRRLGVCGKYVLFSAWSTIKNQEWIRNLESLFNEEGIVLVGLPKTTMSSFKSPLRHNLEFPISPLEWYDTIKFSNGYIGELMHPLIVSLHNSVPVYSFDTYGFNRFWKLDVKSSKIYQVLSRFGLLKNYYNHKLHMHLPTPQVVFDLISNFDREACHSMSATMLDEYNDMMNKSLDI